MVATAAMCARRLEAGAYELALNFGVCGAFDPELTTTTVVHVVDDTMPELGAEDGEAFLTLEDLALRLVPPRVTFPSGATPIDRVSTVLARSTVSQ